MVRMRAHIIWTSRGQRPGASRVTLSLAATVDIDLHGRAKPVRGVGYLARARCRHHHTAQQTTVLPLQAGGRRVKRRLDSSQTHDDEDCGVLLLLPSAASLRAHRVDYLAELVAVN